jgi:hypothetical protein
MLTVTACSKTGQQLPVQEEKTAVAALALSTASFKGMNWADPNDNFADGLVIPSGLSSSDNYTAVQSKAANILSAFTQRGANTVRLPINPYTVSAAWWAAYRGAIDQALSGGMKVILAYWEGSSSKDGLVDNLTAFWQMWQTVTSQYGGNSQVYFEVFNEPHGYSVTDLKSLYAQWLSNYPSIPQNRVLLDGAGYATNVNDIGADSRFSSCLLSYHMYTWFDNSKTTSADWEQSITSLSYPDRTVLTEFGIPLTTGKNYLGAPGTDVEITYLQGLTNALRSKQMGSVYWPGLRTGDSYSMLTLSGTTLSTNNNAGLQRVQYGWGNITVAQPLASLDGSAYYKIVSRNSGKALDVNGSSTADGAAMIQWDYWGGNNQQWQLAAAGNYFTIANRNSNKLLDVSGGSTTAGTGLVQQTAGSATSQQWQVTDIGYGYYSLINRNSGQSVDVNGGSTANGAGIIQWYWNGGRNQQWQIVKL